MPGLVGREREVTRLRAFLSELASEPSTLVIEGEPGIGKTMLFEAAIAEAVEPLVLRVRCAEAECGLAYAGLTDLLGRAIDTVLPALPAAQRRALEIVLGQAEAGQETLEPHVVARGTLEALRSLAAVTPVLIAIDDVQWLDPASARALAFAARRLEAAPVGLLLTRRTTDGPLPLGLDDALPQRRRERLLLGPLDIADLEVVVEERLGEPLPRALRRRMGAMAAGNPLYAIELVSAQRQSGRPLSDPLSVPARLEELLADRLNRLPPGAAQPLAAVAGLAAPTAHLVVAALGDGANAGLDSALDAGVLLAEEGRLRFSHPLLGAAALARVAPSARRALHAGLAAILIDPEERARHLVLATDGPHAAVADAVERGADHARARGAPEVAAELAEAAIRLTPLDRIEDVRRRRVAAGYHRVAAGEVRRGRAHLAAALDGVPPGLTRADLRWRLGMLSFLDGELDRAVELLEAALAEASGDRPLEALITRRLAGVSSWQGRLKEAVRLSRLALEQAEAIGDPMGLLEALNGYALGAFFIGELPAGLLGRIEGLARTAGPVQPHQDPDHFLAYLLHLTGGGTASAASRLERVYRRAAEEGDELGLAWASGRLAQIELAAGRWPQARRLAEESLRTARRMASVPALAPALLAVALVEAHLGNAEVGEKAAAELIELAERHGIRSFVVDGLAIRGFLALSRGDAQGAHAELGPLPGRLDDQGVREPTVQHLVWSDLDALVELGELDRADALAAELDARGRVLDRPFALATAARARGLVLAVRGDLDGARAELERSLAEHDRLGWPFERARSLLALGVIQRRGKQKRAAREALQHALGLFDGLGARLWSARTTEELARIGGRPQRAGSLTPTERRVAELVAEGHTNREVADLLFLSAKTVAAHLTSTYAKLGVRSRTELARHVRDVPPHASR